MRGRWRGTTESWTDVGVHNAMMRAATAGDVGGTRVLKRMHVYVESFAYTEDFISGGKVSF